MKLTATISRSYRIRLGLVAGLLWFFCLVPVPHVSGFLYDGMVRYPEQQEVYEEYRELRETHENWREVWAEQMREHGYPEVPDERTDMDILTQYLIAGILAVLGTLFLVGFLRTFGRWVAVDDEGLVTNSGHRATWDAIESVDSERWKTKGIAVVHYRDEQGQAQRITLDDWKFDREATQAIYEQVRQAVGAGESGDGKGGEGEGEGGASGEGVAEGEARS